MRKKSHESHTLVEPQVALRVYLDALLCEATFAAAEEDANNADDQGARADVAETAISSVHNTADIDNEITVEHESVSIDKCACIVQPDWANEPFQCLSFQVAGVTLAAPLEKLNGIVELAEEITELPGYAPWVIGLLPNRGQNVQVVDIARIIMPDENDVASKPAADRMKFVILLEDGKFGLVADSISQVLRLEADDVRWRSEQSKRPWLAGTVIEKMCAILEIDRLCEQLRAGLKGI